jgi:hypothetical protein
MTYSATEGQGRDINSAVTQNQGGQIGQMFICWVIVYIGQFKKNTEVVQILKVLIFKGKRDAVILTQKLFWLDFGHFFTNSSGTNVVISKIFRRKI